MKKIGFLALLIFGVLFPIGVEAQNKLLLDEDKSVNNGEEARFALSIDLDSAYDNKIKKIIFDLEVTGGSTGNSSYIKTENTNLWNVTVNDNKTYTLSTNTISGIVKTDHLLDLIIPVKEDCPEGSITVAITNVVFYHEVEDTESSQNMILEPIIEDTTGSARLINVTRLILSPVALLESLTVSLGELTPAFDQNTNEYDVVVKDTINKLTIEARCQNMCSSINGNTNQVFKKSYTLVKGENDPIEIKVISQNGLNSEEYVVNIFRGELLEERADLKSLSITNVTLDPEFNTSIYNYYVKTPANLDSLELIYELFDEKSTVTVTGNENLEIGKENKITITILSVDEKIEHSYNIYATREDETSSSTIIEDNTSSSEIIPKEKSNLLWIILIIFGSLIIIGLSFFFIFKNKNKGKKKKKKETVNPEVIISHDDDDELLEYTKEYTDLVKKIDEKKQIDDLKIDDYKKL